MSVHGLVVFILTVAISSLIGRSQTAQVLQLHYEVSEAVPVGTIVASLPACSNQTPLTYSLQNDAFGVGTDGLLQVKQMLDREAVNVHMFTVPVIHAAREVCRIMVHIDVGDVNDNAPVFTQSYYHMQLPAVLNPGDNVGQIQAADADLGENARVTYSLGKPSSIFSIDAVSGMIRVLNPALMTTETVTLFVQASDNGTPRRTSTVDVHIMAASMAGHNMANMPGHTMK